MNTIFEQLIAHPDFREGDYWSRMQLDSGKEIIKQGESSDYLYLLESGDVRVMGDVELDENRRVKPGVCDMKPGDVFGEMVMFDDQPRSASVMATSDCVLIRIHGKKTMGFLEQHPELGFAVLKMLTQSMVDRLRKTNKKIFSLFAWGLKAHGLEKHL